MIGAGELADPTIATSYRLCVYGDGALAMRPLLESGASWTSKRSKFTYANKAANADGITTAALKAGSPAKLLVKGKGANLTLPLPLAASTTILVQFVEDAASGGRCWQSSFDAADAINSGALFKDKL